MKKIGMSYERHTVGKGNLSPRSIETHIFLDNLRSLYNVGSIFRTAEAVGISHVHLCGMTPTPDNPRLAKTAIGAEKIIAWDYHKNGLIAAKKLRDDGFSLWAIEGGAEATPLFETDISQDRQKIVLIIGNELAGVDPEILSLCERVLYIPMEGNKESLNVTVAFGIAAYFLRYPLG
ncbi:MAG: RNA methyltransferase [Chloroflexi bacterium]|nr:RNA methyltransferase [Chloroflexota bacterium]